MHTHDLKSPIPEFRAKVDGTMNFDVRYNDKDFRVGDEVIFHEVNPDESYTGETFHCKIAYIMLGPDRGLLPDMCVMSTYGGFLVTR